MTQSQASMTRPWRSTALLLLTLAATGCLDTTVDASYPTMAEATAEGAVTRGWVPEWVPPDALELREVHDLDSNESALSFSIPANTRLALPDHCRPVAASKVPPVGFDRTWWPAQDELERLYTFHSCRGEFVGLDNSGRHVLHWRTKIR